MAKHHYSDERIGSLVRQIGETEVRLRQLKDQFREAMGSKPFDVDEDGKPTPEFVSVSWDQRVPGKDEWNR